ncbi:MULTISPECIES: TPM domain-containing protein [unclassified Modestobacter]|uniref:TPM domain-containing protein n=1 Tax=unclassified Modestobacter TaxID=2643866 RepID=UPI0022AA28E8|nr:MULTISPECIES: TPM domain-containing protein [unclassified Modestobacter]MCZ2827173.1 TPM domain-containing protein [Modestobacter sp. VKM Ac-2981]MCZ2854919.1 TPM domain-containing protein [Modestobacter sp. VKM Ac-2982]
MRTRIALLVLLITGLLPAGTAMAAQPVALDTPITDEAGVLGADAAAAEEAVAELRAQTGIDLSAVFVPSFDGEEDDADWAELTAMESELGDEEVLLAVATDEAEYEWWVGDESTLQPEAVETLMSEDVEPAIVEGDWSGAVVALADGLQSTDVVDPAMPSWSATRTAVVVVVLAGVLTAFYLVSRRGSPEDHEPETEPARQS